MLTDLSDVAKNAGNYAVQFLADIPVKFYLLNIRLFHPHQPGEDFDDETRELALRQLDKRAVELSGLTPNSQHKFSVIYSENDLIGATRKFVEEKKIDLIVMGAAHKGHSPNTIIGNHTYEVIKKIKCNILAVAENCKFKQPQKMIMPVDTQTPLGKQNFDFLRRRGVAPEASLRIIEIRDDSAPDISDDSREKFLSQFNDRKVKLMQVERSKALSEEQLLEVQKHFDLIILLGKNIFICDELLHTEQGLYSTVVNNLPILVLHR